MPELLPLYKKYVKKFLLKHPSFSYRVKISLTPQFLKKCEKRIIQGAKKYGGDWKYKNNLKERSNEEADHFNYSILHECQQEYKKSRK